MIRLVTLAVLAMTFLPRPLHAQDADGPVRAQRHMVATANPLASEAARAVLREGGSAIDAAIAGQMVLGVVEPQSSGVGGGSLLLVWTASDRKLAFYEGLASAPGTIIDDWTTGPDGRRIPTATLERSGRVVGVPGTVPTLALVHARHGRLAWARLFDDAIRLADGGFPLAPYLHATLVQRPELARKAAFAGYFDTDGKPLPIGTVLHNRPLAATLRAIAAEGDAALRSGPIAAAIVHAVTADPLPGTITAADLAAYQPKERAAVCAVAFGHRICTAAPPVSGGIALIQQLVMLETLGIARTTPGSVEAAHLMIEAARLSAADRRVFIGDPDQVAVPVAGLLEPGYLTGRARLISPARALGTVVAGDPPEKHAELPPSDPLGLTATTHLSIVDDAGDAVSFTTTINQNFGADMVSGGMVLNDVLTNFAVRGVVDGKRAANAIAPGKRAITTMAPTIVFGRDDRPMLIVGAGGGARIIDSVAQTILGVLAWNQDVRSAIVAPRIGGQNGAEELERGTDAAMLADPLRALGHNPHVVEMNAGVQAVMVTPEGLRGWADPRRDGVALGD